jgi:hypothetical protein
VWIAPYGVFDWQWFEKIDCRLSPEATTPQKVYPRLSRLNHAVFFRFESQMVIAACMISLLPYSADGVVSTNTERGVLFVLAPLVLLSALLMGLEVLIGRAVMGDGYRKYLHCERNEVPSNSHDGRLLLREILGLFPFTVLRIDRIICQLLGLLLDKR